MRVFVPARRHSTIPLYTSENFFKQVLSLVLAWAMVMTCMPVYAADQPSANWVKGSVSSAQPLAPEPGIAQPHSSAIQPRAPRTAARPVAAAGAPALFGPPVPVPAVLAGAFVPPLQASGTPLLQVSVGFADNSSHSAGFPEPWNESNPLVHFVGGGTVYRAGAIRLDNPTGTDIIADSVTVDLGRPGPVFQLWSNVTVPAFGSAVLTQTQDGNFNTSGSPIVGCGVALAANEARIPKVTVTVGGTGTDYLDSAHVLDTGGFDSSCRGNQSLAWRPIGTTGMEATSATVQLITDNAPHAVGTQNVVNVQMNDAAGQALANAPISLQVVNGPNAGKSFTGVTDGSGNATLQYSSSAQGTDLLQAVAANVTGGSLQSQQISTTWTSADACSAPATANAAATRMIYVGQTTTTFGNPLRLAALLTDGTGTPLANRTLAFAFGAQTQSATTDNNGVATALATLDVGPTSVGISFAGDQNFQPVQLNTSVSVGRAATLLRYTGSNLVGSLGTQTVTALLTDAQGRAAVVNRTVSFTLNGATVTAVTNVNGAAAATFNFQPEQPSGPAQLQINFAGDTNYQPSTRTVPVQIYEVMPFVIWGGNNGGLRIGERVNFWGDQWTRQVINGASFAANASFKGWGGSVPALQQCQANATPATLTAACWQVKPGQSFPPAITLPAFIEVVVSTVINKSRDTVFGNIACGAIVQVDHTPPYGAVPGQPGFGNIVAVNGDCAGVFPQPVRLVASQQQPDPVLPGQQITVDYSIANQGATDATSVALNENFDQLTPATGSASLGTIIAGGSASGNFPVAIPAIGARQATESSVDYQSRLAASDGRLFTSEGEITFSDPFNQTYAPVEISSFSQLNLPRLAIGLSGLNCIAPGTKVPYQVKIDNLGSATAEKIAARLALPDNTATPLTVADLPTGMSFAGTVNWQAPGVAAKGASETTADYLARLQAVDGVVLPAAVASATWQDHLTNSYGPVEQPFASLTQRVPIVSLVTPASQSQLPAQKTQLSFPTSNIGTGNAVQVTLQIKKPDNRLITLPNFSLPGGQSATLNTNFTAPTVAPKGAAESDADYLARLLAANGATLPLDAILSWTDSAGNNYGPTDNPFSMTTQLPVVNVTLSAPATANSGDTITYTVTLANSGSASAVIGNLSLTLPDGSVRHPAAAGTSLAAGASFSANQTYAIPSEQPNSTIAASVSVTWNDAVPNAYGPVDASASTVVTQPNLPPVVSAGPDQTVPFPNSFPLQGSVTDDGKPVGGQLTSTWTQVSGPAPAIFADPHSPTSAVTLSAEGVYVLKLTGDDSRLQTSAQVTITTIRGNKAPVVTVGPDQTIELPVNSVTLTGSATDDGLPVGSSLTYAWSLVAGPGTVSFGSATAPGTSATFTAVGTYLLRLTVSDSQLSGSADVRVNVLPHNNPPQVNAGPSQTIILPVTTAALQGAVTDDGLPAGGQLTSLWSVVSGPGLVIFGNSNSPATSATFPVPGVYVLRLTANDSLLSASSDVTINVRPANLPPLVNAGPNQTITLPSNATSLPLVPTVIAISTGFNNPIAVDYHQPTNKVVMSVNYSGGTPHNFELVAADGSRTQFSNISGLTDEVYIASARDEGNGLSIGGFHAGEMFTGSGVAGVIVRVSADGTSVQNPWVRLPGEPGLLRGQLYIDRTGIFGGDLIVATTAGNVWRVTSAGVPTKLAGLNILLEGLLTVPADPQKYGPWAGKIITGSENLQRVFAIDAQGVVTFFDLGIAPENIKLINPGDNFFGVDFASSTLRGIPAPELSGMVGDILIGEETPGNLWQIHWNGSRFETTRIAQVPQWEGTTTAPAGIAQVAATTASVTLNGTVSDDGLPAGGHLTSQWTKVSGPGLATFTSPLTPVTTVSFSLPGVYVLRLSASDSELTSTSDTTITIAANQPPVVNAGSEQQSTFPATFNLNGVVTDDGLPATGHLSTFWSKVSGPGQISFTAASFNASEDFSATVNPSGNWTYGSTPTRGGAFTPYAFTGQVSGLPAWFRTSPAAGTTFPLLVFNNTGAPTAFSTVAMPPDTFLLHPGSSGENSVLRWTAPAAGTFLVQGRFFGLDTTTTDVAVLLNSSTTLLSGNINGRNAGVPFTFVKTLSAGDRLDFSVGFGNGNFNSDSTGLTVIITQAGPAATVASLSQPGAYIARLAAYDGEAYSFNDIHLQSIAPCVTPPSGMVGWWPGDGDTRDLASANTGVIEDGVAFVPGMVGQAFSFNGAAADVVVPASTALNVSSLTFDAWIFPLDMGTQRPIMEYSATNGTIGPHMWTNLNASVATTNGALYANIVDSNGSFHILSTGGGALGIRQWNHVALTYDHATGTARLYVNGAAITTVSLGVFTPRTTLPLYIGARPNSTHFLGHIDEVEVFNRALTPAEIQAIYSAGTSGKCKPTGPQPPVVSAGLDQTIILPVTQVTLNGTATDPNGGQLSIAWSVVSAQGTVTFGNAASPATTATFSAAGVYVLRLTAGNAQSTVSRDVTITVIAPTNKAPVVDPGPNLTIQLPVSSVTLNGKVTDDGLPLGSTVTQLWTRLSGPGTVTFTAPTQPVTQATFSTAGTYTLQLAATDSLLSTSAPVTITVLPAPTPNQGPSITVSVDNVNITLPASTVTLTGTITDDGQPVGSTITAQWTLASGPAPVTFTAPTSASTKAIFTTAGSYVLKLTASDSQLDTSLTIPITVNPPAPNQAPIVSVIASASAITLPNSTVGLTGKITDDGLPVGGAITLQWTLVSGPAPVTFSNPTGGSTLAAFSTPGIYVIQLAASDSQLTGTGTTSITVNPAGTNQAPTVAVTADRTALTLPTNTATLTGAITDDGLPSGTITTQWSQVSGPAAVMTQLNPTTITVTFNVVGVYVFKLTASDGQLSSSATITITVTTAGGNQPPTVTAGANQTIQWPQNTVALQGDARDDGLPLGSTLTVSWSEVSGPTPVTFTNPNSLVTQATFGAAGVYVLQLTASDSLLQATSQVTITVNTTPAPPPPPPVVSVTSLANGAEITAPTPIVGSVSSGSWKLEYSLLDGAGNPTTFVTFASGTTPVSNATLGTFDPTVLLNGQYLVRFSSTDAAGQTASSSSTVDVSRNAKVGNFTMSFNDLSVPLPGLPITAARTYDSRDKRVGDFGVGWTLSIANVRIQKSGGPIGKGWDEETQWSGFFPTYCLQPIKKHIVSITFPDDRVFKFSPVSVPGCQFLIPFLAAQIGFVQIPTGSATAGATLTPIGGSDFLLNGSVPGPQDILDFDLSFADFTQFQLVTAEGFRYTLDQTLGITQVIDPNGNALTINALGVISSSGKSVAFTRDAQGRITQITDPAGNLLIYSYDAAGDLASFTDRSNNTTSYSYDNAHLLLNITDPRGLQPIRNTYDDAGRLVSTTDANGHVVNYAHDLASNHEVVTDRLGNPTTYEYDDDGNVTRETDALGNTRTFTYDANDNKLSETNALGQTTAFMYDAAGNRTSETDPLGHVKKFTYNSRNQILTLTDAAGHVTTRVYDNNGNQLSESDPLGGKTSHTYSSSGQEITTTDALGSTTSSQYDAQGNLIKQTDPLGNVTTFTYDGNGNKLSQGASRTRSDGTTETLTTRYQYDASNRLIKTTKPDGSNTQTTYNSIGKQSDSIDALGRTTHYDYDASGQLIKTSYPDGTSEISTYDAGNHRLTSTDKAGRTTSFTYDALGRLTRTTNPDGSGSQTVYDAAGQVVKTIDALGNATVFAYDNAGRRISTTDALGNTSSFAYDNAGNQISFTDALGHLMQYSYDAAGRRTQTVYLDHTSDTQSYDAVGHLIARTDQAGNARQFGYDKTGRLITVTDALGHVTRYSYDEVGNRVSQTDANGHVILFAYDQLGRRIQRTLPLGQSESLSYDAAGNVVSRTDFNRKTTTFLYDPLNRLLQKTPDASFNASAVKYTFTATGKRASMTDASGTTTYSYDQQDRLLSAATPRGTLTYSYDVAGNLLSTQSSNPGGSAMTYGYDKLSRLLSITDVSGVTSYDYDAAGNLLKIALPNGTATAYSYNALNRLVQLTASKATTQIASYNYTLGSAGNRLSVTELNGRTVQYGYDSLYRLTSETISGAGPQNGAISYLYDNVGNRLQLTSSVTAIPSGLLNYDANDQITTDPYDANGNTISNGGINNLYDFEDHLVQRGNVTIVYDGDGNRVSKTAAGVTTNYLVDINSPTGYAQVLDEVQGGSVIRSYSYGLKLLSQRDLSSGVATTSFYGYDGHGNVRFLTSSSGTVTDTYDYDAFGNLIASTGNTTNNYRFAGEQFDADLNLYYNRARYLDVRTGRFWGRDIDKHNVFDPLDLHTYLYANADPVNRSDASGNQASIAEVGVEIDMDLMLAAAITLTALLLLSRILGNTKVNAEIPFRANHYTSLAVLPLIFVGGINSPSGQNFVTTDYYFAGSTAKKMLALPNKPEVFINLFVFKFGDALIGPTEVQPKYGEPGGGTEYVTGEIIPVLRRAPIVVPLLDIFD